MRSYKPNWRCCTAINKIPLRRFCNVRNNMMYGLALLLAVQAFARDEYSRNFDKTVTLASGQSVRLAPRMGSVNLRTPAGREVVVHASTRVSASNAAEAKRVAEQIGIEVAPAGSALVIRTEYPKEEHDGFFGFHNLSYSVNLDVTMPETAPLELRNSFGSVSIEDLKANADVTNAHGKLTFRNGRGTQRLENQFAAVEVTGNAGDVTIRNGNGSVDVSDVTGIVNVKNRFANVTVTNPGHGGTIVNGNGAVQVTGAGGDLRITNLFGKVTVSGVKVCGRRGHGQCRRCDYPEWQRKRGCFRCHRHRERQKPLCECHRNQSGTRRHDRERQRRRAGYGRGRRFAHHQFVRQGDRKQRKGEPGRRQRQRRGRGE